MRILTICKSIYCYYLTCAVKSSASLNSIIGGNIGSDDRRDRGDGGINTRGERSAELIAMVPMDVIALN